MYYIMHRKTYKIVFKGTEAECNEEIKEMSASYQIYFNRPIIKENRMNKLQRQAQKELEELLINHAETGRDREACYPSQDEEEAIMLLEEVIDGCPEATKEYVMSKLNPLCRDCVQLDLSCEGVSIDNKKELHCFLPGPEDERMVTCPCCYGADTGEYCRICGGRGELPSFKVKKFNK